jgi:hypothetical protein
MSIDNAIMQSQDLVEVGRADGMGRKAKELKDWMMCRSKPNVGSYNPSAQELHDPAETSKQRR